MKLITLADIQAEIAASNCDHFAWTIELPIGSPTAELEAWCDRQGISCIVGTKLIQLRR